MTRTHKEELVHLLSDLYAMELQALAQLEMAPGLAGAVSLRDIYRVHREETEWQAQALRGRMEELGAEPSPIKDAVMKLGGKGMIWFAKVQPETPGKLLAHAYSYEAMEWAGYEVLRHLAEQAGDPVTAEIARSIQDQEREMMQRLENQWDVAEEASHGEASRGELPGHVVRHLQEAHALEKQSLTLLQEGADVPEDPALQALAASHAKATEGQLRLLEERLYRAGSSSSTLKDTALKLGGLNWSLFFRAQSNRSARLTVFLYAVSHLEMAGYELLKRVAERAEDTETVPLCEGILAEDRAFSEKLETQLRAEAETVAEETIPSGRA